MGICAQCTHFRRVKPSSQLLAAVINTTDAAVSNALTKIVEDEQKQRDAEAEYKRAQASSDKDVWATRPVMSDFCGLRESDGTYLIAEVKNLGGRCDKFTAGRPVRHACADCGHRLEPGGPAEDAAMEKAYSDMATSSISSGLQPGNADNLLNKYREGVISRKGFEVSGAYAAQGVVASRPKYLDYCGKLSIEDEFHVCALINPHHTCTLWEAGAAKPAQPEVRPPVPAVATATVATPAAPSTPAVPPIPSGATVIVAGDPPLTQALVEDVAAFFEWILDVPLGAPERGLLRRHLISSWEKHDTDEISSLTAQIQMLRQVEAADQTMRAYWREENQQQLVAALREAKDPVADALLGLYDRSNVPIAQGNPPLTREMADSMLDLFVFLQAVVVGAPPQPVPRETRDAWAQQCIAQYPYLGAQAHAWIADTPKLITMLRAAWQQLAPGDRAGYIEQLKAQFAGLFAAAPAYAPYIQPPPMSPFAAPVAPPAPEPQRSSVDELLDKMIKDQEKEEAELQRTNPQLAAMKKLQNQQANAQLMSNMMKMSHDTSMAIINNIR